MRKRRKFTLSPREIPPTLAGVFFLIGLFLLQHSVLGAEIEEGVVRLGTSPGFRAAVLEPLGSLFSFGWTPRELREKNARLEEENRLLLRRVVELEGLRRENQALRAILNSPLSYENPARLKIARLLGNSPSRPKEILYVDLGRNGGVAVDDLVTFPEKTLVGKVTKVFDEHAVVETIFHPETKIAVLIGEESREGLFLGGGKAKASFIPKDATLSVGDTVVTSGRDGTFPRGFLVGKVKEIISRPAEPFQEVLVSLAAEFLGEETLSILKNPLR